MGTRLKKIGNSFVIILNKEMLQKAGIISSKTINIGVKENTIVITQADRDIVVNLNRSCWGAQFKKSYKNRTQTGKISMGRRW